MIGSISAGYVVAARTRSGTTSASFSSSIVTDVPDLHRGSVAGRVDPGGEAVPDRGPARRVLEVVPRGRGAGVRGAGDTQADLEIARALRRLGEAEALVEPLRGVAEVLDGRAAIDRQVAVRLDLRAPARDRPRRATPDADRLEGDGRRARHPGGQLEALLGDGGGVGRRPAGPRAGAFRGTEGVADLPDDRADVEGRRGARVRGRGGPHGRRRRRAGNDVAAPGEDGEQQQYGGCKRAKGAGRHASIGAEGRQRCKLRGSRGRSAPAASSGAELRPLQPAAAIAAAIASRVRAISSSPE